MARFLWRLRSSYPDLDITMSELTTLQQVDALKKGRIEIGFGRLQFDDPDVKQDVLREERLIAALPIGHRLLNSFGSLRLKDLASETLIIYPKHPRPSYADQVLSSFRERKLEPAHVAEVSELQSALGLAAAALGVCLVPASVQRLRRDDIVYRDLTDKTAVSPIIMTCRANDASPAITALRQTIRKLYNRERSRNWPEELRNKEDAMLVRIIYGKLKPGSWDSYEHAYKEIMSNTGKIAGLRGRWRARRR
jgi:LysR family transcriptional regulator, benzoate and cis,cis-muconate-responsive activator of ben and cat genes